MLRRVYHLLASKLRDVGKPARSPHWRVVEHQWLLEHGACAGCGTKKHLQVHHKKPFHLKPELELDETNLVTLCMDTKECHLHIGHGGSFKFYNPYIDMDLTCLAAGSMTYDEVVRLARRDRLSA